MQPSIPDVEIFVAMKYIFLLMLASGLMTLSGLLVKRWWYGSEKHNRRGDEKDSRGWLDRFLKLQETHNSFIAELRDNMAGMQRELHENGTFLKTLADNSKCLFDEHILSKSFIQSRKK